MNNVLTMKKDENIRPSFRYIDWIFFCFYIWSKLFHMDCTVACALW